jgi:hypothetical protein
VRLRPTDAKIWYYGTVYGTLGVLIEASADQYEILSKLQMNLSKSLKSIGEIPFGDWRDFTNERRVTDHRGILDGDFIERFLELDEEKQRLVLSARNGGMPIKESLNQIVSLVEDFARLH